MPAYKNYIFRSTNEEDTEYIYDYLKGLGYDTRSILNNDYEKWNYYILVKTLEKYCIAGSKHSEQDVIDVIKKDYPDTYMRFYDMNSLDIFKKMVDFSNRPSYEPRKIVRESTGNEDIIKQLLAEGKYDILMFTINRYDTGKAMQLKNFLRKLGIDKYELMNNHENFNPVNDVYVIFTKKPSGSHLPFTLMTFGNFMIYEFFKEFYSEFKSPSPIMTPDEFMDYVTKTTLLKAKMMYSPRKMSRDI